MLKKSFEFECEKCEADIVGEVGYDDGIRVCCSRCGAEHYVETNTKGEPTVFLEEYDAWQDEREVPQQPPWLKDIQPVTYSDCMAIRQGGCVSGAYMPAVTYRTAEEVMHKWGDDILDYLEEYNGGECVPGPPQQSSWAGIACYYYSYAVELFACLALEEVE